MNLNESTTWQNAIDVLLSDSGKTDIEVIWRNHNCFGRPLERQRKYYGVGYDAHELNEGYYASEYLVRAGIYKVTSREKRKPVYRYGDHRLPALEVIVYTLTDFGKQVACHLFPEIEIADAS